MADENKNAPGASSQKAEKQKKSTRRKVLANTLAGGIVASTGALSSKWRKPVLDAVVLPGHAVTTDSSSSSDGVTTTSEPSTTEMPV